MKLYHVELLNTDEWHEDNGNCLFFHFESYDEPPKVYVGSPLECDFDEDYWCYFTVDMDFNSIIYQAQQLDLVNSSACDNIE